MQICSAGAILQQAMENKGTQIVTIEHDDVIFEQKTLAC